MTAPADGPPSAVPAPLDRPPPVDEARSPEDFPEAGLGSLAAFSQRVGGLVIDYLPFYVVANVILLSASPGGDPAAAPAWLIPSFNVGFLVLQVAMLAATGRTVGCYATGIRIARYYDGAKPQVHQAMIRCLIPAGAGAMFDPLGVGELGIFTELAIYLSALADPLLRGLHDKAAGTIVVRTR